MASLDSLQARLGYRFRHPELLQQALTHRSHNAQHNERLEFLGDSVVNFVVASMLFQRFTTIDEGDLSRLRASLVKQSTLADLATALGLPDHLRLGEGELKSGGFRRPSILADALEAIFGAVYLDAGFDAAHDVIRAQYQALIEPINPRTLGKDAKTLLQEVLQARKIDLPVYTVVATHGAAHSQLFEVSCTVKVLDICVKAAGSSRRAAEQEAAKQALDLIQSLPAKKTGRTRIHNLPQSASSVTSHQENK